MAGKTVVDKYRTNDHLETILFYKTQNVFYIGTCYNNETI